ncbi:MAG: hypothetical protein CM1200mP27_07930 [Chloroflexota bacterium]|nr:MAG: hypothetical protein CM1200mP27_07930 [Chloroflexota bacterium]
MVYSGQFFKGPGQTVLETGELLAEIRIPAPARNTGSHYIKHSPRGAMDMLPSELLHLLRGKGRKAPHLTFGSHWEQLLLHRCVLTRRRPPYAGKYKS